MTPQPAQIAHYKITAKLGEGGMGAVYRATDTRLNREVALKVLPEAFAADPDRMARFEREAQMLAALNHPNIAAIYGIEQGAIVMELVEGAALAGPLPIATAIDYARQIAVALEAAHEKGIIHRDLKPANIIVTPDGVVKLLDFGLAKAGEETASRPSMSPTISPTLSLAMTQAGMILGTAAYMSPEQAKGKPVDKRADIWAFGVVFYEMLSGRHLYGGGETVTDTLAAVVLKDPDWNALPDDTPPRVRRLLERCLRKDPKQRLRDIGDARLTLEEAEPAVAAGVQASPARTSKLPWMVAAALGVAAVAGGVGWWRASQPEPKEVMRFDVNLGPAATSGLRSTAVLSPDGRRIAYPAILPSGRFGILTRLLEQATPVVLQGTEAISNLDVSFSYDGQWLVYGQDGSFRKVAVAGGTPIALAEVSSVRGVAWGPDDTLVFGSASGGGLMRVPASGGTPQRLTDPASVQESSHSWPQFLPGGKKVLYVAAKGFGGFNEGELKVLSLDTGQAKTVHKGGFFPRYVNSGHLLFVRENAIYAVRFDPAKLEVKGVPAQVLQGVASNAGAGSAFFDVSRTGTLVYSPAGTGGSRQQFAWMGADGAQKPLPLPAADYVTPALSPDGKRLAYTLRTSAGADIWVFDLARETATQVTFNAVRSNAWELVWTPDSRHILFAGAGSLWSVRADGSGAPVKILESLFGVRPHSLSADGKLLFYSLVQNGLPDIWTVALDTSDPDHPKPGTPQVFVAAPYVETDPAISPNGHWVAYASNESGREDVFVRPFPAGSNGGGKFRISMDGGKFPAWSPTGHELYFLGGDDRIMAVSYAENGENFNAGKPRVWSEKAVQRTGVQKSIDLHPDGKRFVGFVRRAQDSGVGGGLHVTVVVNFLEELKRLVP